MRSVSLAGLRKDEDSGSDSMPSAEFSSKDLDEPISPRDFDGSDVDGVRQGVGGCTLPMLENRN